MQYIVGTEHYGDTAMKVRVGRGDLDSTFAHGWKPLVLAHGNGNVTQKEGRGYTGINLEHRISCQPHARDGTVPPEMRLLPPSS